MSLRIVIDATSAVPPYEQVRLGIAGLARDGALPAGTRLPTVRQLAADLGLATNTVARAYRELEQAGLVETRGRNGTFVTAAAAGVPPEARRLASEYADGIRRLGLAPAQAVQLVEAALGVPPAER
jgi:DNA-binding transcriptional regulator YhcF (GntR family)